MRKSLLAMSAGVLMLAVSACNSGVTLDYLEVDAAQFLSEGQRSVQYQVDVPQGGFTAVDQPAAISGVFDFSSSDINLNVSKGSLKPTVLFEHDIQGSGKLSAQLYVAPATVAPSAVFADAYKLGNPIEVDVGKASQVLENELNFTPAQLRAINAKKIRVAFKISGAATSTEAKKATLKLTVQKLLIKVERVKL